VSIASGRAVASPTVSATVAATTAAPRHAVYLEAFGKGGLWGLGYAYALRPQLAVGGVASLTWLDGQRIASLSPSLTWYPLATTHHRWFVDGGPQLVRLSTPSPVPEWSGTAANGLGVQLATGYEYRHGVLVRVFAMAVAGQGGLAPWFGADVGWTL